MGIPLNDADEQILALLDEARQTPTSLAEQTEWSRPYISDRLTRLREHGLIARVSTGLYELSDDGREAL
jgi:predicted transcriptional regulator